ncbi:MAG: hypothetical protein EGR42_06080 [[Eubacterium] rectale]|nr:hypothetical protein [Agathobacter rectalis]MBD9037705.1 hypothetical protein [Agathobacter rectalis]
MLILKEHLPEDTLDFKPIMMPYENVEDAVNSVLHVDLQYGLPCMWYDAGDYDKLDGQKTKYRVIPVGTGHYWKKNGDKDIVSKENYIGTALLEGGTLVLHYFLVKAEDNFK